MIFVIFITSLLGGIAGHQTRRLTRNIQGGWSNLVEHGIGGLLLLPFILLFWLAYGGEKKELPRVFAAVMGALLGVGAGVAAGYLADNLIWRQE